MASFKQATTSLNMAAWFWKTATCLTRSSAAACRQGQGAIYEYLITQGSLSRTYHPGQLARTLMKPLTLACNQVLLPI
jgi:hypothetical protein